MIIAQLKTKIQKLSFLTLYVANYNQNPRTANLANMKQHPKIYKKIKNFQKDMSDHHESTKNVNLNIRIIAS